MSNPSVVQLISHKMILSSADNTLIRFDSCQIRNCMSMPIEDDDVVEETETVTIRLERTVDLDNRITIGVSSGVIEIMDNDSMYIIIVPIEIYPAKLISDHYSSISSG